MKHCLEFVPPQTIKSEELEEYQRRTLDRLYDWAEMLTGLYDEDDTILLTD